MCVSYQHIFIVGIGFDQGFNSTITATVEAPRRDQIKESKLGLHSGIKESLATLCSDPNTDVVILSGSKRDVLEEVPPFTFGQLCYKEYFVSIYIAVEYDYFAVMFLQ